MWNDAEGIKLITSLQKIIPEIKKLADEEPVNRKVIDDLKFHIRVLRNACTQGKEFQDFITQQPETAEFIDLVVNRNLGNQDIITLSWQFTANLGVQNAAAQSFIWEHWGHAIISDIRCRPINKNTDKKLMILYNICKGGLPDFNEKLCLALLADVWRKMFDEQSTEDLDFVDLFFEYFLVSNQWTARSFATLSEQNRIDILKYIATYIENDSPNGVIRPILMEYISKQFKKKADCILKCCSSDFNNLHAQEVYSMLTVIASSTGSGMYNEAYKTDDSLFLTVGALLKSIHAIGKKSDNLFTPMASLDQVAPKSKIAANFEDEISFRLKTLLVRTIGNLLSIKPSNQQHCIDIKLMPDLLECTSMDARNPLIREWSILAIRNACIDCPELQQMIADLTQTGVAPNELLAELNLDMGALRIDPKK